MSIESNDWNITYFVQFVYSNNHKIPWQAIVSNILEGILGVKHLVFHATLSSGLIYTKFAKRLYILGFFVLYKSSFYRFPKGHRSKDNEHCRGCI